MNGYMKMLNRNPKSGAVTGLAFFKRIAIVEKMTGEKDRRDNQLVGSKNGQTTPFVDARCKAYGNYVANMYLLADRVTEKSVEEAVKLNAELNLLVNQDKESPIGNEEEISRARRRAAIKASEDKKRREEIVMRLSEIRAYVETIDEKLLHHIEAAKSMYEVHVSNYWSGILKASQPGEINAFPVFDVENIKCRELYAESRNRFYRELGNAIKTGGGAYEE